MSNIDGLGPDAKIEVRSNGAATSKTPYRFDLLPSLALADIAEVMARGAEKYGVNNWKLLPAEDHLNHAMQHIFAHTAGDNQELDELEHARHVATRILFWLECLEMDKRGIVPTNAIAYADKMVGYWDSGSMWHEGLPPEDMDSKTYILSKAAQAVGTARQ